MRRISITFTVAAVALVVAACGSDTDAFVRDYNAAQQPLQQILSDSAGASDPAKLAALADGLDSTAKQLGELEAPKDAQDELDAFVKQIDESAKTIRGLQDAKPEELVAGLTALQEQMSQIGAAEAKLRTAIDR